MALDANSIVIELLAKTDEFNSKIDSATTAFESAMDRQSDAAKRSEVARGGSLDRILAAIENAASRQIAAIEQSSAAEIAAAGQVAKAQQGTADAITSSAERIASAFQRESNAAAASAAAEEQASQRRRRARKDEDAEAQSLSDRDVARRLRLQQQIRGTAEVVERSSAAAANATRNLSFQIGDVGTQLASGASPFLIIAQQGPQVTQALQDITASGATLGQVMKGIALPGFLAILSVLPSLIQYLTSGSDAAEAHAKAEKSLADAIRDQEAASRAAIATGQRQIYVDLARADAALKVAVAKREELKASLANRREQASAAAAGERTGLLTLGIPGRGASSQQAMVRDLERQIAAQDSAISTAQANVVRRRAKITQQLVTEALDPVARATGHYERQVDLLNSRLQRGQVTEGQYRSELIRLTRERDAATSATEKHTRSTSRSAGASREHASAAREQAKALDTLKSDLESLERQLDPSAVAAEDFAKSLDTIRRARLSGLVDDARAAELAFKATMAEEKRLREEREKRAKEIFGDPTLVRPGSTVQEQIRAEQEARDRAEQETQRKRESNVRDLAYLYEDLFTGGVRSVWDDFKRMGLRAIAELLAQWTLAAFSPQKDGGGLGDIFGFLPGASNVGYGRDWGGAFGSRSSGIPGLILSLFGRASGGYVAPNSVHRVNESAGGVELLKMGPQGGAVIPLGRAKAAQPAAGVTVLQTVSVDARGAVMNDQFASMILSRANQDAQQISAAYSGAAVQASPARTQRLQTLGT